MTDNIEDMDDFDIYADLDDNIDLNFNDPDNTIDNYKSFSDIDLPSILTKTAETNDENTEIQTQIVNNHDFEVRTKGHTTGSVAKNPETDSSNDMILSEITILEKSLNKTEDINKNLLKQNQQLRQQLKEKDKQLAVLKTNISSLYKTAKAEIERKKLEIHGLREELDSMIFRRLSRNGIKLDDSQQTVVQQNQSQTEEHKSVCHKTSQTNYRDFKHNANTHKKSPDSSVRSPKEVPKNSRRIIKSPPKSSQRALRRSRSNSRQTNRNTPPKSSKKSRRSRSKSFEKTRRRSRSRSIQRYRKERHRTPDGNRHRTNSERQSNHSFKHKDEEKKRKSDKSVAKPLTDPKSDKKK